MCRAGPSVIFSMASEKSRAWTALWPFRAASSAASLTRFRSSAPTRPGVSAASRSRSTSAASGPAPARSADGVELVDEDDRRGGLARLLEEVADARGPHADDHLDEFRRAQAEEGHAGLARDRPGEQRLPRAGRADEQHAFGYGAAKPLVLRGVLQEVDDLDELVLGVVDAGDVVEGDLRLLLAVALGAAGPESEDPAAARRHALVQPDERRDQEERGAEAEEHVLD